MMSRSAVVSEWIAALSAGDRSRAGRMISDDFGIHEGLSGPAYLGHELEEFRARREGFGLGEKPNVIVTERGDGACHVIVLTADGRLAYEDALIVDETGRIAGNGRPLETVTKLSFRKGTAAPRRAMAIRSHGLDLKAVAPLFPTGEFSFRPSPTFDRFSLVEFEDEGAPVGVVRRFRAVVGKKGVSFEAFMRGIDHVFFIPDRFPTLDGRSVRIDLSKGPVWSLTAFLEDSSVRVIDCPRDERIEFPCAVIGATMTDAVDNDWSVGEGRAR